MAQFLYRVIAVRPGMLTDGPTPEEAEITGEHFRYLQTLVESGVVILAGRTQNPDYSSFGVIIFNAENETDAWEIVQNDPAVRGRVMRAELYPYQIALHAPQNA